MEYVTPPDTQGGYWAEFPASYRAEQIATIAQWIVTGESGMVVGLSGTGKSNLVGFMASRPEIICERLPGVATDYCFPHLDINSLPAVTTPNFYRSMLYAMQEAPTRIDQRLMRSLAQLITDTQHREDPLALYLGLQRAHALLIQGARKKVIWLIDRFDEACRRLETGTLNSLRHLRDNSHFKGQLAYVVFTRQPLARLRNPTEYDEFHEIMIPNTCWVGAMVTRDAHWIARQMAERHGMPLNEPTVALLIELTGGWPAFMKAACTALARGELPPQATIQDWAERLLAQPAFQRNCQEIWNDCSPLEQAVLGAIASGRDYRVYDADTIAYLAKIGLLTHAAVTLPPRLFSPIFTAFVKRQKLNQAHGITIDPKTGVVLRDGAPLQAELAPLEYRLLAYFLEHSGEICEKDALIDYIWAEAVSDESLTQLVKRLRDRIETGGANHSYIQTMRGRGYRFVQPKE